ncbi:BMC domain-containing protein [Rahnella sp. AA]|uniref:BMC domain-containing protein n=1 Tax=Rahnella sp. AA TaxID=2057180 RepID=UPI000C328037|nr:BMC domain-containing protein [Rahnella sp. AA]PKE29531.1 BMC domain-containing protein [Rahnella sp. AA]
MSGLSLGLIETVGLAAAVEAADAAMKSAHVTLVGYELTKGGGMVTIKLEGEIGAINAAVAAGVIAARKVGVVYAHKVIARTAQHIESLIYSAETKGITPAEPEPEALPPSPTIQPSIIAVVNVEEIPQTSCMELASVAEPVGEPVISETAEDKKPQPAAVNTKKNTSGRGNKKA